MPLTLLVNPSSAGGKGLRLLTVVGVVTPSAAPLGGLNGIFRYPTIHVGSGNRGVNRRAHRKAPFFKAFWALAV